MVNLWAQWLGEVPITQTLPEFRNKRSGSPVYYLFSTLKEAERVGEKMHVKY